MQIEAKDISGFLPLKYETDNDQGVLSDDETGYNNAIDEISTKKLSVVIDREKLAKLIQPLEDKYEDYCIRFKLQSDIRTFGEYIADAIISSAKTDNGLVTIRSVE